MNESPIFNKPSDYAIPYTDFDKVFKVNIPNGIEWGKINPIEGYNVKRYTNRCKMSCGVASGIFSDDLVINLTIQIYIDS